MSDFTQIIHNLPASGLLPVLVLVAVGLLLWAAGRRILRFAFAVIGLLIGGVVGWVVGEIMNVGVLSWAFAAVGAFTFACVAALALRLAVTAAMIGVFALLAPLAVITVLEFRVNRAGKTLSEVEVSNPVSDEITRWLQQHDDPALRQGATVAIETWSKSAREQYDRAKSALDASFEGETNQTIDHVERFGGQMVEALRAKWDSTPQSLRPTLLVSCVIGGLTGFLAGIVAFKISAAAITSLGGSLLWLAGMQILAIRIEVPDGPWMPTTSSGWLAAWLITSALGVVIQWMFHKRPADKPS
jgi:hypothetical protein